MVVVAMGEDVLQRVLQGNRRGDHYAVLGVQPEIGGDKVSAQERLRRFLVVKVSCCEGAFASSPYCHIEICVVPGSPYSMYLIKPRYQLVWVWICFWRPTRH